MADATIDVKTDEEEEEEKTVDTVEEKDEYEVDFQDNTIKPWSQLTTNEKMKKVAIVCIKFCFILGALYFFICSLSFLADAFRLLAGKQAGEIFRNSEVFNNQVAGCLVGVLVTVLVQSSSTSTSIFITMVAAELLTVKQTIPLVMGANIGTSVTSTIVAMGQVGDRNEFRRAFAAATVHDMFNFLSVIVLLPLEMISQYLYYLSKAIIDATPGLESGEKPPDILKKITKPFTGKIIKVDKKLISKIAEADGDELEELMGQRMLVHLFGIDAEDIDLSDSAVGVLTLIFSLLILCFTLFVIVYLLKSILKGHIAVWLHKGVNGQVPDIKCGGTTIPMRWLSGYLAMLVGLGMTICVQSSSITTSALTPLVGVGVLRLERMYPTVLGANIGTCITGVLAALAADGSKLFLTLQVAYAHLFFNLSGIFLFYVIWPMRRFPIKAAKLMGDTTAKYRWFALAYLFVCFFFIPAIVMGIAIGSNAAAIAVIVLCVVIALLVSGINWMQTRYPEKLPAKLRTWDWMPLWFRSLEPYDQHVFRPLGNFLGRTCTCCKVCKVDEKQAQEKGDEKQAQENPEEKEAQEKEAQEKPDPEEKEAQDAQAISKTNA